MKNSDEAVERVLAGLREAEAPEGMERRILEAVRDGVPQQRDWSFGGRRIPLRLVGTMSWAAAAAGVLVVAGMLCWSSLRGPRVGDRNAVPKEKMEVATTLIPQPEMRSAKAIEERTRTLIASSKGSIHSRRNPLVREKEATARSEMRAAGYPAPPMPLTEQEKLLLQVVQQGDPEEIAMLNPAVRAVQDAEETFEFGEFFGRVNIGDHE